jgi:hypothetical protein
MGANNVLPTIPTFTAGAPALTDLQNLSYAASFLIDHGVRPTWKFIMYTTPAISASTWTVVPFTDIIYDSDGVASNPLTPTSAIIKTQGYYAVDSSVQMENTASRINFITAFKWTAGASSPYSAQSPAWFGYRGTSTGVIGSGSANQGSCVSAITPVPMYPADTLQVMVFISAAAALEPNDDLTYMTGRFSTQFTGRWVRQGS